MKAEYTKDFKEYMEAIKAIQFFAEDNANCRFHAYSSPNRSFSELFILARSLIEVGFDQKADFFAHFTKNCSGIYLLDDSDLESAIRQHIEPKDQEKVLSDIYGVARPAISMHACEVMLATQGIYIEHGYLKQKSENP